VTKTKKKKKCGDYLEHRQQSEYSEKKKKKKKCGDYLEHRQQSE